MNIQHKQLECETGLEQVLNICTFISWPRRLRSDSETYSF